MTKWNAQQEDVFESMAVNEENHIIEANAGCAKTTTSREVHHRMSPEDQNSAISVAFNKHIAEEMKPGMPPGVKVSTIHAACMGAILSTYGPRTSKYVNTWKYKNIVDEGFAKMGIAGKNDGQTWQWKDTCVDLIGKSMATLSDTEPMQIIQMMMHFNMDCEMDPELISTVVTKARKIGLDEVKYEIDFNDMLHLVATGVIDTPKYNNVAIDEAQDMGPAQQEVVLRLMEKGGRMLAVGDENQAIYGFIGSDIQGIKTFDRRLSLLGGVIRKPLEICYRCPTEVLRYAQYFVPGIKAAPGAAVGSVDVIPNLDNIYENGWGKSDYWVCRTTAPLIEQCLDFIRRDMPAAIIGKDASKPIKKIMQALEQMEDFDFCDFSEYLDLYIEKTTELYKKQSRPEMAIMSMLDYSSSLRFVYEKGVIGHGINTMKGLSLYLDSLFKEDPEVGRISLCTAHKSKGLQGKNIYVLRSDLLPHPRAIMPWEQVQENNLLYIICTRSQQTLNFIGSMPECLEGL